MQRIYEMICVYDNPITMRRECWQNKKLIYFISYEFFYLKEFPRINVHVGINLLGDWKEGQYFGNKSAIGKALKSIT